MSCHKNQPHAMKGEVKPEHLKRALSHWPLALTVHQGLELISLPGRGVLKTLLLTWLRLWITSSQTLPGDAEHVSTLTQQLGVLT